MTGVLKSPEAAGWRRNTGSNATEGTSAVVVVEVLPALLLSLVCWEVLNNQMGHFCSITVIYCPPESRVSEC